MPKIQEIMAVLGKISIKMYLHICFRKRRRRSRCSRRLEKEILAAAARAAAENYYLSPIQTKNKTWQKHVFCFKNFQNTKNAEGRVVFGKIGAKMFLFAFETEVFLSWLGGCTEIIILMLLLRA